MLVRGIEDSGAMPRVVLGTWNPFVRDKEDVPHEHAIPDLYGLQAAGVTAKQGRILKSIEDLRLGRRRQDVLDLIDTSTVITCSQDADTLGLLIIRTTAHPVGEYIDIVTTDLMGDQGYARLRQLEAELGASLDDMEVEHGAVNRPHAAVFGSSSFKFIRICKAVVA